MDLISRHSHPVKSTRHYKKRQCGIQPAGKSYHRTPAVDMFHTFLKSHSLDIQDLLTALITFFLHRRNERILRILSGKSGFFLCYGKTNSCMATDGNCRICGHSSSLISQSLYIDLTVNNAVLKTSAFRKHGAIFRDHILSAEHKILSGLALSCACVNISADQPCGLPAYQSSPVGILPYHLIAGRKIDDNMGAVDGMTDTWRCRNPEILTELCRNSEFREFLTLKDQVCSKRNLITELIFLIFHALQEVHKFHIFFLCTGKLSLFIKLIIIRNMGLRHKSHDTAMIQGSCHIIELASVTQRKSHKDQGIRLFCLVCNMQKFIPRTVQKTSLEKKIVAGIACDTEFRKYHQLDMLFFHFMNGLQDFLPVCLAVCNGNSRRCCCHLDKTMLHFFFLLRLIACTLL